METDRCHSSHVLHVRLQILMVIAVVIFPLGEGSPSISTSYRMSSEDETATTHEITWINLVTTYGGYCIFIVMFYGEGILGLKLGLFGFVFFPKPLLCLLFQEQINHLGIVWQQECGGEIGKFK